MNAPSYSTSGPSAEPGRKFLESVLVWPASPQAPGWINLHVNAKNNEPAKNNGKPWVVGWPFKTVDDTLNRIAWVQSTDTFFNVWVCMSQQSECTQKANGKAKAVRKAANATWLKAIWIDCDVKPGDPKHYHTMPEAFDALDAFRNKVGLPFPSAIVNSGGGLHVYWISDTPLSAADWRPYADGLKNLLLREGIKCDTGLTTDVARILRVPDTLNHKYTPPRMVSLPHYGRSYDFATALRILLDATPTTSAPCTASPSLVPTIEPGHESKFANGPDPAFAALTGSDDLAAGIVRRNSVSLDPTPVFEKCGFMRHARDIGGADYNNPLWMYSILCASFLENGNELAHEISKGHATYTYDDTQDMYERKLADRAERGVGWPSCSTICGAGCVSCAACPLLGHGKSPLHFTRPITGTANSSVAAVPTTWSPADLKVTFSNIRHRRTLYGHDLVRGEITVLGSPGGVGKSSLAIGIAASIAAGKELLGEKIHGSNLRVLLVNAEDSTVEIRRRVWAFCRAHSVTERELDYLYVAGADDPRVQGLSFLRTNEKGHSELDGAGLAQVRAALQLLAPDVIVLDPLVALCANGNMNDNPSMSLVMRALKALATEFDSAILVVHHTRKNAEAGIADAISGAASIVNLARRAIMPVPLSAEEAAGLGILPSERPRYFKLVDAKSNLAPRSTDMPIYRLHSVELPNPEPPTYPFGDNVQAVARVEPSSLPGVAGSTDDKKIRQAILDLVARGKVIDGKPYPYAPSAAGADNARALLQDAIEAARAATDPQQWAPSDLKAVVKAAIKSMKTEGVLVSREMKDLTPGPGRFRKGQGLQINPALTARGDTDEADHKAAAQRCGQLVNSRSMD